jgi:hypothetical protein
LLSSGAGRTCTDLTSESIRLTHGEDAAPVTGQIRLHSRHVLRVVDHFLEIEGGKPTKLRRTFLESRRDSQMGFQQMDGLAPIAPMKQSGPLGNGVAVVFEWSPEESRYGRYFDAREGEEEDLIGLEEDLDLRALLPAEPVAVGASWNASRSRSAISSLRAAGFRTSCRARPIRACCERSRRDSRARSTTPSRTSTRGHSS